MRLISPALISPRVFSGGASKRSRCSPRALPREDSTSTRGTQPYRSAGRTLREAGYRSDGQSVKRGQFEFRAFTPGACGAYSVAQPDIVPQSLFVSERYGRSGAHVRCEACDWP